MNLFRMHFAWSVMLIGLACGCMSPGLSKMAKSSPKIDQDQFSCGEKTPPRLREAPLH